MPDTANHKPRHLYDTGTFKTLPPEKQVRPKKYVNEHRGAAGPNVAANGSNTYVWPVVDADPTRKVRTLAPRPAVPMPKVTVEPARKPVSWLHVAMWVAVVVVPLIAAAAMVVTS
jgi:hypothetical protein